MSNIKFKLVLCTWNNYFSRKVRNIRQEAGEDYLSVMNYFQTNQIEFQAFADINFKYNDGVATKQIIIDYINSSYDISKANYLLVFDESSYLSHCWFIMESTYESGSKYILTLKRDLVVDYYGKIRTLPMFVQKGLLQDDDPMIFNREGMSFNQIKVEQTLLKERNQEAPWIVGYIDSSYSEEPTIIANPSNGDFINIDRYPIHLNDESDISRGGVYFSQKTAIELIGSFEWFKMLTSATRYNLKALFYYNDDNYRLSDSKRVTNNYIGYDTSKHFALFDYNTTITAGFPGTRNFLDKYWDVVDENYQSVNNSLKQYFDDNELEMVSNEQDFELLNLQNEIVYSPSRNKYYKITINASGSRKKTLNLTANGETAQLYNVMRSICYTTLERLSLERRFSERGNPYQLQWEYNVYEIYFEEVTVPGEIRITLSNGRRKLEDAPFDMFCLPFSERNLQLAQNMVKELSTHMYDCQIVPYCPGRFMMVDGEIDRTGMQEGIDYTVIQVNTENGWEDSGKEIIYCRRSSDSINIPFIMSVDDIKVDNETKFIRLVASNHGSSFEFSPAKNGGVDGFVVTYSYKPYTPYIHVKPLFKGLYGSTFPGDSRGVTFVGDFSIDMLDDKWKDFQVQNKNYRATFNNEIQTMDKMNQINIAEQAIGSTLGAAAGGIAVGGMTGNAAAGVAAGAASMAGGVADIFLGQEKYRLNKQLKVSQFEYQLGNIKALPKTISKVTAYCIDNLYFPYVEVYDATEVEKNALRDKINYDGMTVMRIGTIDEFSSGRSDYDLNFFKAELITIPYDLEGDFHEISELALMLEKGIYL